MRRKKQVYPPAKTATKGQPAVVPGGFDPRNPPGRTVTINLAAGAGRVIRVGDKVRISTGLFAGEAAVVESASSGVIPSVMVRTESGRTRRARSIDLEPITGDASPPANSSPSSSAPEG